MSQRAIVSISCVRQAGLLAAVSERLFELGCNLADTTYALLAGSAEFTTVCELPCPCPTAPTPPRSPPRPTPSA